MKVSWDKKTVVELAELLEDIVSRVELLEGKYVAQVESGSALKPQPVATLCEAVDGLLRDDHFWEWYKEDSVRLYHALSAERKRAVLVDELIKQVRLARAYLVRPVLHAIEDLDAFDKGVENG